MSWLWNLSALPSSLRAWLYGMSSGGRWKWDLCLIGVKGHGGLLESGTACKILLELFFLLSEREILLK